MAKHHSLEEKRAAIELRKAGVPLKMIRDQLKMNLRTVQRLFAAAKQPSFVVTKRKVGTGTKSTISQATLTTMRRKLTKDPTLTAKELTVGAESMACVESMARRRFAADTAPTVHFLNDFFS